MKNLYLNCFLKKLKINQHLAPKWYLCFGHMIWWHFVIFFRIWTWKQLIWCKINVYWGLWNEFYWLDEHTYISQKVAKFPVDSCKFFFKSYKLKMGVRVSHRWEIWYIRTLYGQLGKFFYFRRKTFMPIACLRLLEGTSSGQIVW